MAGFLGIDVGGTFTDVIMADESDGSILIEKVPSTPLDPSEGVLAALVRLCGVRHIDLASLSLFAHGSTVGTNALLESRLPKTALIVTKGFRDVLEIGTQLRHEMFDLAIRKPVPLVPRALVFEVDERIDGSGEVVQPLTDEGIDSVVEAVAAAEVDACAVSLIFAFRNPEHERRLADAIAKRLPDVPVSISSDIAPEIKEFPRTSTTVINAALRPLVANYIAGIERGRRRQGMTCPFYVMQSSGGVMAADEASQNAHHMVLSGPAAGVIAAGRLAAVTPYRNQITFDMGGTSTDICLIRDGKARIDREPVLDGRPLRVPQLDIHTIGSGGGSIAWVDPGGMLHVGPQSAGATPGPACYSRGGTLPTVTDAHVALGRIAPDHFLAGEMALDDAAARQAVLEHVGRRLGMTLEEAALGILDIADAVMARGIRVVSVNRGLDPRDFALVAYGGAGPMHAVTAGQLAEVDTVVVPPRPGAFSAFGLVNADVRYDLVRTIEASLDDYPAAAVESLYAELLAEAMERLDAVGREYPRRLIRTLRLRYAWQVGDIEVTVGEEPLDDEGLSAAVARFHDLHDQEFGYKDLTERLEIVAVGIEARAQLPGATFRAAGAEERYEPLASRTQSACFRKTGWVETAIYWRNDLKPGASLVGPAVIEERESTTIVPPGVTATVDRFLDIVLSREGE